MNLKQTYTRLLSREPRFDRLVSQCVTQSQMDSICYRRWCEEELRQPFLYHRKPWEWAYITEAIGQAGLLKPGYAGIGFGVGVEPLVAILARHRLDILATDQDPLQARKHGWETGKSYGGALEWLNPGELTNPEVFRAHVSFRVVDMNRIPDDLRDFDFCWSSCALEHLGSLQAGFTFIENSLKCIKPGGLAVHTTEYNVSSNEHTITEGPTVFYRQVDLKAFGRRLRQMGYHIRFNFSTGRRPADLHVDDPPYGNGPHLKLRVGSYVVTSIGLIIRKPA